jgi:uncharacterized membrane protein YgaE (UPF0421/DUF939 family)
MTETIKRNFPAIIGATLGIALGLFVSAMALYSIAKGIQYFWGMG